MKLYRAAVSYINFSLGDPINNYISQSLVMSLISELVKGPPEKQRR